MMEKIAIQGAQDMRKLVVVAHAGTVLTASCGSTVSTSTSPSTSIESAAPTAAASSTTQPAPTTTTDQEHRRVRIAFSSSDGTSCSDVSVADRSLAPDTDPLRSAFDLLVARPTPAEEADGFASPFSEATAGTVWSKDLDNGLLVVDFEDSRTELNNASTSCGSEALLAQLNATAFEFGDVERVTYAVAGSCETFFNWLQCECTQYARP